MSSHLLRARRAIGTPTALAPKRDADVIASHLEDAAHVPGGHSPVLFTPGNEAEISEILRTTATVLPIGAQSSLTGGATPMGEAILSTARLSRIEHIGADHVRVQAGVTMAALDEALERVGRYYPPGPTFTGAFVGGTVSTNAAGATTFKYGSTRSWVDALTIVLASGDVLDVVRGATTADPSGCFHLELLDGPVRVTVPTYRTPRVAKVSAGYFAEEGMDLIDLFIGSEGTLGVVTEVTLRVLPARPAFCLALIMCADRDIALAFVSRLRDEAAISWQNDGRRGLDVSAVEYMDARCLALLRQDGIDQREGLTLPDDSVLALLVTLELPPGTTTAQAYDEIARAADDGREGLAFFVALLEEFGLLDHTTIAAPGDRAMAERLLNIREAVPAAVNMRVGRAQRDVDLRIEKTAADMIVPFDRLAELLNFYEAGFRRRGLDAAIWGHLSDGNVHPNVIPRTYADVEAGRAAILEFGERAIELGGAPLAEHGVGRNSTKQQLLAMLYGADGLDQMRRVKAALDPEWKLAPGVIFPRVPERRA